MLNLFKIEWLKIKSYRTFWVLFLAFIIFYPLAFYFSANKYMEVTSAGTEGKMLKAFLASPFVFPRVWLGASWMGGLFFILIGMLFILLITNEVQYRTHRQNIIDGWSREQFINVKIAIAVIVALVATLVVIITGLVFGFASGTSFSLTHFESVFFFFSFFNAS